eukprot:s3962_g6.t1
MMYVRNVWLGSCHLLSAASDTGYIKMAGGCATFCTILSAVAVPVLIFFGFLCSVGSPMMEIPEDKKPEAGQGCYMAAALYAATGLYAYQKAAKS